MIPYSSAFDYIHLFYFIRLLLVIYLTMFNITPQELEEARKRMREAEELDEQEALKLPRQNSGGDSTSAAASSKATRSSRTSSASAAPSAAAPAPSVESPGVSHQPSAVAAGPQLLLSAAQCTKVLSMNLKTLQCLATAMGLSETTKPAISVRAIRFCGSCDSMTFDANAADFKFDGLTEQAFQPPAAVTPP